MQLLLAVLFNLILVNLVSGQNGPRLSIPGAFLASDARPQFRNERLNNVGPLIRIRRPLGKQSNPNVLPQTQRLEEAKPVTEDPEDNIPESFVPQILQYQQQQQNLLQTDGNSIQDDPQQQIEEKLQLPRFQERPAPQRQQDIQNVNAQRFSLTERPPKPTTLRSRPIHREPRPQFEQPQPQPIQHQPRAHNFQPRPQQYNPPAHNEDRTQKPVAQILRKWREENEDGTITWGFENDDGSFKEEVIGTDCVTRGRYGYVDPDGLKREYNYETGILCDPNKRDQPDDDDEKQGFINYENNKAVLPNGVEIDLSLMGKKKSKRPGAVLTNPQQFYSRN